MSRSVAVLIIAVFVGAAAAFAPPVAVAEDAVTGFSAVVSGGEWVSPLPDFAIRFETIGGPGVVTVTREVTSRQFPYFDLGTPPYAYTVASTFGSSGKIRVCITFDPARFVVPRYSVRLAQIDGEDIALITNEYGETVSCGDTDHLSVFAAAQNFGMSPLRFSRADAGNAVLAPVGGAVSAGDSPRVTPHSRTISFHSAAGEGRLIVENGLIPATGARVLLNGKVIGGGSLFKRHQNQLFAPVELLGGSNILEVSIDGGPGSSFTLSIRHAP